MRIITSELDRMDNKLLHDHLIHHNLDYFYVCIVKCIYVGSNYIENILINYQAEKNENRFGIWVS